MKVNKNYPKVKLDRPSLSDNRYTREVYYWSVCNLIRYCKEHKYKVFDLPLASLDLSVIPWEDISNFKNIAKHANRALHANLRNPIILDDYGYVCDGWHRILKALLLGQTTIKAIRIQKMPKPDGKETEES